MESLTSKYVRLKVNALCLTMNTEVFSLFNRTLKQRGNAPLPPNKYAVIPQHALWGGDYSILLESQWKMKFTLVCYVPKRNHENPLHYRVLKMRCFLPQENTENKLGDCHLGQ